MPFLNNFLHFRFQFIQIFSGKRRMLKIIIIPIVNTGANGQFGIGIQPLHRFRQHMGCGMAHYSQPLLIVCRKDIQAAVTVDDSPQIHHFSVHLPGTCRSGQPFADICGNVNDSHR